MAGRSRIPRGQVDKHQKAVLEKERNFLLEELDCKHVVDSLREKGFLDADDHEYILGRWGNRHSANEQNALLLDVIGKRTPAGFMAFMSALRDTGHEQAFKQVKQTLEVIKNGSEAQHQNQTLPPSEETRLLSESVFVYSVEHDNSDGQKQTAILNMPLGGIEIHVNATGNRFEKLTLHGTTQTDTVQQGTYDNALIGELEKTVNTLKAEKEELSDRLDRTAQDLAAIPKRLDNLENENKKLRAKLRRLKHKDVSLEAISQEGELANTETGDKKGDDNGIHTVNFSERLINTHSRLQRNQFQIMTSPRQSKTLSANYADNVPMTITGQKAILSPRQTVASSVITDDDNARSS
ncbi:hypothetical protein BaRGS_00028102 [Batillaria attramentaria]|uniref:CARD domain-containing protein n=1 Tax=Batillaria attramentaria TaxID=370345 RepID=A0ABD0K0V1_9CAEN